MLGPPPSPAKLSRSSRSFRNVSDPRNCADRPCGFTFVPWPVADEKLSESNEIPMNSRSVLIRMNVKFWSSPVKL